MPKIFISAGDHSGDIHASKLMRQLKNKIEDIEFVGIGGSAMEKEGLQSIVRLSDISVVGFLEVAKNYRKLKALLDKSKSIIKDEGIDLLLTVDYPGFNLRLAKYANSLGIKTCQYIAPQAWAWGKDRAKHFSQYLDLLLVVFPFEMDFFQNYGLDAKFVGHPLMDDPVFEKPVRPLEERDKTIAFLPGSRVQEIKRHAKLYDNVVDRLSSNHSDYEFVVATSNSLDKSVYEQHFKNPKIKFESNSRDLMQRARAGVVKTGTSTLEAALCGMPFTMIYKTSLFTYQYGKYLVNLPYLSLVNILENHPIVKELIQGQATTSNIIIEMEKLIGNDNYAQRLLDAFVSIRQSLGAKGASEAAANEISKLLSK